MKVEVAPFSGLIAPKRPTKRGPHRTSILCQRWRFLTQAERSASPCNAEVRAAIAATDRRRLILRGNKNDELDRLILRRVEARLEASLTELVQSPRMPSIQVASEQTTSSPEVTSGEFLESADALLHGRSSPWSGVQSLTDGSLETPIVGGLESASRSETSKDHWSLQPLKRCSFWAMRKCPGSQLSSPSTIVRGTKAALRRPAEAVSLADQVPDELLLNPTSGGAVGNNRPGAKWRIASKLSKGCSPNDVVCSPERPCSQRREDRKRTKIALEILRASRAQSAPPARRVARPYGKWYLPVKCWNAGNTSGSAPMTAIDVNNAAKKQDLDDRAKSLQHQIGNAYIARQFKQFIDERHFRMPRALEALNVEKNSVLPSFDNIRGHIIPMLTTMCATPTVHRLRKELKAHCLPPATTQIPVRSLRNVLAANGIRFTDEEFRQLVAIASNQPPQHTFSRLLKVDSAIFMLRAEQLLKYANWRSAHT